jgi:hypothetical protein
MRIIGSSEEIRLMARRALAFGYAALDSPTRKKVKEALEQVRRVLTAVPSKLGGGEIAELLAALRLLAQQLNGIADQAA